jgi:NADPH2:quinone reductase
MLALVNTPSGKRLVEMREVPEPTPAPDEALVEVRAFSLNRGDFYLLARQPEGWIPGNDVSGVVTRAASDGSGPREGSRVVGFVGDSGWEQRVAMPVDRLAVPSVAGLTALRALRLGGLLLGRRVLVTGGQPRAGRGAAGSRGGELRVDRQ